MHTYKNVSKNSTVLRIRTLQQHDLAGVAELATLVHGAGYTEPQQLASWLVQGTKAGQCACLLAEVEKRIVAYRISFAPGQWQTDLWCSVALWPVPLEKMAYFKSVAVHPDWQGQGIGQRLLQNSIQALKQQGATAGLAHLWRESPNNSAVRYFSKAGGRLLQIHPNRWQHLSADGYLCPRCGAVCCCSAAEMVLEF